MIRRWIESQNSYKALAPFLRNSASRQTTLGQWLADSASQQMTTLGRWLAEMPGALEVLDLGCGEGKSIYLFQRVIPSARWRGVDISSSPEVDRRQRHDLPCETFDGVNLPYANETFDLIYCGQVLEHVRHPDKLMADAARVLKRGGVFLGSVSYLEPYHSNSIFNFTPYGLSRVVEDVGLNLLELRPGIDAPSILMRQILGGPRLLNFLFRSSPLHWAISTAALLTGLPRPLAGFLKIQYCGIFCFLARRPD